MNFPHQSDRLDATGERLDLIRARQRPVLVLGVALQHRVAPLLADGLAAGLEEHPVDAVHGGAEAVFAQGLIAELLEGR